MAKSQVLNGFVSLTDLAPTFLSAAGLTIPGEMTGRNLLPAVTGGGDVKLREYVLFGKERHVPSQEAPDMGGYPTRAIRTPDFLYIRNYEPGRWPNGTPDWKKAAFPGAWFGDTDGGPTKNYIVANKDKDEAHRRAWDWCFAKRPAEELFDLKKDPHQLVNVAGGVAYADILKKLSAQLTTDLVASKDPRHTDAPVLFDSYPYSGGTPKHPDYKIRN